MIKAIDRGLFPALGSGLSRKSLTYVENSVDVLMECLVGPPACNDTFNVSNRTVFNGWSGQGHCPKAGQSNRVVCLPWVAAAWVARLFDSSCGALNIQPPVTRRNVAVLMTDSVCEVIRLRDKLNYESRIGLDEGMERTVAWYLRSKQAVRGGR